MKFYKKYHKWVGVISVLFILNFAFSGILLNHRKYISGIDISRRWLPKDYHFNNWNNAAVVGTLKLSSDTVLMYGNSGVWITDSLCLNVKAFDKGINKGVDNRSFRNVVKLANGEIFGVGTHELYQLDINTKTWQRITEKLSVEEAFADLEAKGDTLLVVSRSHIFKATSPYNVFERVNLRAPSNYSPKVSLFKTMWILHSGEIFGLPGKLVVDALGVVIVVLTLTGLALTLLRIPMRSRKKKRIDAANLKKTWKFSLKWHNKLGAGLFVLLLFIVMTGMFLRPPLLIPIAKIQVNPIPFSTLDSDNPWNGKLRTLRYNPASDSWLLYSSSGFYQFKDFAARPQAVKTKPPVSVMGVTVLEPKSKDTWLVGSFTGLYLWNVDKGWAYDAFTKELYKPKKTFAPPVLSNPISGYSNDFALGEVVFNYKEGAVGLLHQPFVQMPSVVADAPMSLWHFALELHVGRMYTLLGRLSVLFVFFSGLFFLFILISGYKVYKKYHKKKRKKVA